MSLFNKTIIWNKLLKMFGQLMLLVSHRIFSMQIPIHIPMALNALKTSDRQIYKSKEIEDLSCIDHALKIWLQTLMHQKSTRENMYSSNTLRQLMLFKQIHKNLKHNRYSCFPHNQPCDNRHELAKQEVWQQNIIKVDRSRKLFSIRMFQR